MATTTEPVWTEEEEWVPPFWALAVVGTGMAACVFLAIAVLMILLSWAVGE